MTIEVIQNNLGKVLCRSKYGQFFAYWYEDEISENKTYHIELDTEEKLFLGVNLFIVSEGEPCICNSGEKVKIVGKVETIEKDGYMVVRLGSSLLTFVTDNEIVTGSIVKVLLDHVSAYPIDY